VPSLICKDCLAADQNGTKKLDKSVRCDLCVEQGIYSKATIREQQAAALQQYEERQRQKGLLEAAVVAIGGTSTSSTLSGPKTLKDGSSRDRDQETITGEFSIAGELPQQHQGAVVTAANPDQITRLYLKNMCRKTMTEDVLLEHFPSITHIVWNTRKGTFLGQGWVEMESPMAAAQAVARSGETVLGRPLYIDYQAADAKDLWPPPKSAVR
jgi:hypothetical protein